MRAFDPGNLPFVIGHRGAALHAPENTLSGIRAARSLGVEWVEFDVKLTADDRCILLHDDTIDRTTDGSGDAAEMTLDQIAVWDAAGWFGQGIVSEPVPTLEEVVDLLADLQMGANIEIKPSPGREAETARAVVATLREIWPDSLPAPLLSSFRPDSLRAAAAGPEFARGLLLQDLGADWLDLVRDLDCRTVHVAHGGLTAVKVRQVRQAGYPVLAYTVNHRGRADELRSWGVSSVFTDAPDRLFERV
jgi:glycerophosphoryl diester phosphodiesterase